MVISDLKNLKLPHMYTGTDKHINKHIHMPKRDMLA